MKNNLLWLISVAYFLCSKCYLFTNNVMVSKDIYLTLVGWMPTFTQVNWLVNLYNDVPRATIGGGDGTPLQYYCLENPMDGGAW